VVATRRIGDREVSAIALGSASWPFLPGPTDEVDDLGIRAIHAALDEGVTILDTARAYTRADHEGYAEALIARALHNHPSQLRVLVATKGGHYRDGDRFPIDASREAIRRHCESSLQLLGVDRLELYQLHWPDPSTPMRDAMQTFTQLQDEGLIRDIGVSNVSATQFKEARSVADVVSVQNRFSAIDQSDRAMLDYCSEHEIAYLAYSPLGGTVSVPRLAETFPGAAAVAARKQVSIQRLALAWLLHLSPMVIPIVGASKPETVRDSVRAMDVVLDADDLAELDFHQLRTSQ
jgi:aryl-alcohol dehydrogenase-like predicted oxidoreductase